MHSFREMAEIMERERNLDEDWRKWALAGALTAGAVSGGYALTRRPGPERPTQSQTEDAPRRYDHFYQMFSQHQGIHAAEQNLKARQAQHQRKIDLRAQSDGDVRQVKSQDIKDD
jgi:hypothetical protein